MDETRFVIRNLLRHLPPMPRLPEPAVQLLTQADKFLAIGQNELAVQTLALLATMTVPQGGAKPGDFLDLGLAMYLSDCLTNAFTMTGDRPLLPARYSERPGEGRGEGTPSLERVTASGPRGRTIAIITPALVATPGRLAAAAHRLFTANGWAARVCLTSDYAPRDPALRVWKPAPVPAEKPALDADFRAPLTGGVLDAARAASRWLIDQQPAVAVFVGGLVAPICAASQFTRVAPVQVSLCTYDASLIRGVDLVATAAPPPAAWSNRLTWRSIALHDWSGLLAAPDSPVAGVLLDQHLSPRRAEDAPAHDFAVAEVA